MTRLMLLLITACLCCGCGESSKSEPAKTVGDAAKTTEAKEEVPVAESTELDEESIEERLAKAVDVSQFEQPTVTDELKTAEARAAIEALGGVFKSEHTQLTLYNTQITDAGLVHLKVMTGLRQLDLNDTQATDAGVEDLKKSLPQCNIRK